ncbi:hypothetical protein JTB14_028170 [Gonioctena quinquepunctata]|nr:hypothetical protein JTB14_028170 [Gonioctena quinquepunctata]
MDTESVASIRQANWDLFFGATKALISRDSPTSAAYSPTNGPHNQPVETTVSVENESTPAEVVERQLLVEEGFKTGALLDPEDVTLTKINQNSLPTGSCQNTGSQDVIGSPGSLSLTEKQED